MRVCISSFGTHQQCWSSFKVWAMLPISNLKKCIFEPGLKPRSSSRVRLPRPRGPKIWLKISRKSSSYVSRKSLALSQISNRNRRFFSSQSFDINQTMDRLCAKLEPKSLRSSGGTLAGQCSLVRTASLKSAFSFLVLIHAMWASVKDFYCILDLLKRAHCIVLLSIWTVLVCAKLEIMLVNSIYTWVYLPISAPKV